MKLIEKINEKNISKYNLLFSIFLIISLLSISFNKIIYIDLTNKNNNENFIKIEIENQLKNVLKDQINNIKDLVNENNLPKNYYLINNKKEIIKENLINKKHINKNLMLNGFTNYGNFLYYNEHLKEDLFLVNYIEIEEIKNDNIISIGSENLKNELKQTYLFIIILSTLIFLLLYYKLNYILFTYQKKIIKREKDLKKINDLLNSQIKEKINAFNEQSEILLEQSKLTALKEIIKSLIIKFRNDLAPITSSSSGILMYKDTNYTPDINYIFDSQEIIYKNTLKMNNIINVLSDFVVSEDGKAYYKIKDIIEKSIIVEQSIIDAEQINLIIDIDTNEELLCSKSILIQTLISLYNNSIEAFKKNKIQEKQITISCFKKDKEIIISIKDNAGGIDNKIIKEFNNNNLFSIKENNKICLGLYMTKQLLIHNKASIFINKIDYVIDNKMMDGTEVILKIKI